ncbi:C2 domain [Carpediemonas membranifera]|uniref:C2 domain n=1 Tax=Carpediemonas membranifera TaxID=201153 RepID=A0A8J6DZN9_9EUKA|nr:C2 domain [Carpediemonas membranifera]|eukprot:KAG9393909.1 C2 domain [Carpediemonas membranifera]
MVPFLGPYKTMDEALDLIRQYDRDGDDMLDFEDFLQLVGEYEMLLEKEKVRCRSSFEHFKNKYGRALDRETFVRILKTGQMALTSEELTQVVRIYYKGRDHITQQNVLADFSHVQDIFDDIQIPENLPAPHFRVISILIKGAYNAAFYSRPKAVGQAGVHFDGFDPYITVRCGNSTAETAILVHDNNPMWETRVQLKVNFPTSNTADMCRWMMDQYISFTVWDRYSMGRSGHSELIGYSYIPLVSALANAPTAVPHLLLMSTPYLLPPKTPPMVLEAIIQCENDGIFEYFRSNEDIWFTRHRTELEEHLSTFCLCVQADPIHVRYQEPNGPADIAHAPSHILRDPTSQFNFFKIYNRQYKQLRHQFKRRHLRFVQPDEDGIFRPACTHVNAVRSPLKDIKEIALNVARIRDSGPLFPHMPSALSIESTANPAMVLTAQKGTLWERAILLCSLLLGQGVDAYVALGHSNRRRTVWVVTFETPAEREERGLPFEDSGGESAKESSRVQQISKLFVAPEKTRTLAFDLRASEYQHDSVLTTGRRSVRHRKTDIKSLLRAGMGGRALEENFLDAGSDSEDDTVSGSALASAADLGQGNRMSLPTLDLTGIDRSSRKDLATGYDTQRNISRIVTQRTARSFINSKNLKGERCIAVHWDVGTGKQYIDIHASSFPYTRLGMLINATEMYTNVQRYDLLDEMAIDLSTRDYWRPFLGPEALSQSGVPGCWWGPPVQLKRPIPTGNAGEGTAERDTVAIVQLINEYRRRELFVEETRWHRPVCRYLNDVVPSVERCWRRNERSLVLHPYNADIMQRLPPHTLWYGRPFYIKTGNPIEAVEFLTHTGILDCTTEGVTYAIGVRVHHHAWGLKSTSVWVGYMHDLFHELSHGR